MHELVTSLRHINIISLSHTHISFNYLLCFEESKERRHHIKFSCRYSQERINAFSYGIPVSRVHSSFPDVKVFTAPVYSCSGNQHVQKINWYITVVLSPSKAGHLLSSLFVLPVCFSRHRTLIKVSGGSKSNRLHFSLKGLVSTDDISSYACLLSMSLIIRCDGEWWCWAAVLSTRQKNNDGQRFLPFHVHPPLGVGWRECCWTHTWDLSTK